MVDIMLSFIPIIILIVVGVFLYRFVKKKLGETQKLEKSESEIKVRDSQMDFKKLSKYIIILGIVICTFGVFVFLVNLPVSSVGGDFGGFMPEVGRALATHDENLFRSVRRSNATKAIVAGAIVIFVGIAVKSSTKKN